MDSITVQKETVTRAHIDNCIVTVQRISDNPQPWTEIDEKRANDLVKNDPNFSRFLSKLNVENLQEQLIDFSRDLELVQVLEHDVIKHIEGVLRAEFYKGELYRIGSCQDGSKVGKVNELDFLYVISTNVTASRHGKNRYIVREGDTILEPLNIQERLAQILESNLKGSKWGNPRLIHGGYMSPRFSGVRYNGPAVTLLLIHRDRKGREFTRTPLSLDITAAFHLPDDPLFEDIEYNLHSKFIDIKSITDKKILDLSGLHLVPNASEAIWHATTAQLEANLFRDLHHTVPIKLAFGYVKIIAHGLTKANDEGLLQTIVCNTHDHVEYFSKLILECSELSQRLPEEQVMRFAHLFLSKEDADSVAEIVKSAISINTAALKHALLSHAMKTPKMFMETSDKEELEECVYDLVVKAFAVIAEQTSSLPAIQHALLDEAKINVFSVSKKSLINTTYPLLQAILMQQCKSIHNKLNIKKWSFQNSIPLDDNNIVMQKSYTLTPTEELRVAEYTYTMDVDISISPNRNSSVSHLLNLVNGMMNTCGGIVTLRNVSHATVSSVSMWLDKLCALCANYDITFHETRTQFKMCPNHCKCDTSCFLHMDLAVQQSTDDLQQNSSTSHGNQNSTCEDVCLVQIDLRVKPSAQQIWLQYSPSTQVRFQIMQNGQVKYIKHTQKSQSKGIVLENIEKRSQSLFTEGEAQLSSPVGPASPESTSSISEAYIDSILKQTKQLSWTEQHKKHWGTYIEYRPSDIHNRLSTISGILQVARPLIISPSIDMCPPKFRVSLARLQESYKESVGFGVWFYNLQSLPRNIPNDDNHLYVLCYKHGDCKFDLWPLHIDPPNLTGDQNVNLFETGRIIKWLVLDELRQNDWMAREMADVNIAIQCHSIWEESGHVKGAFYEASHCEDVSQRLGAAFAQVMMKEVEEICLKHTLYNNLLLSLTHDQIQHLINFGSHHLNFVEGPPGSGKSVVASFLCDLCVKKWNTKPTYFCASHSFKSVLEKHHNCVPHVIQDDSDLREYLHLEDLNSRACLIVDDAQSMPCTESNWDNLLERVVKDNIIMYVFADHQYQNFKEQTNVDLSDWMYRVATQQRVSFNKSHLSEVHRNSQKIVSFIGACFAEASDMAVPSKIICKHRQQGDDVEIVKVSNLLRFDQDNELLKYLQSIMEEYEPRHIAIMIDCDNATSVIHQMRWMLSSCVRLNCHVHGADSYPRTGITVDHLDNFVGIDAPICIFPIIQNRNTMRTLANPKYKAFIASRAIFRLVLIQVEDFDHRLAMQFQLDQEKLLCADREESEVHTSCFRTDPEVSLNLDEKATITIGETTYDVNPNDLKPLGPLGRGSYTRMDHMSHSPSGTDMAVKKIPYQCNYDKQKKLMMHLYVTMKTKTCPYTVKFYGVLFTEGQMWICMELMDMSLDSFYQKVHRNQRRIPEMVLGKISFAVVSALYYLQTKLEVIHRDVKPSNILINRQGDIKICDFGMSGYLVESVARTRDVRFNPYIAPERIDPIQYSSGYGVRSDVWSLGITLIELATGTFPYNQSGSFFNLLKQIVGDPPPQLPPGEFSADFSTFVNMCLTKDPKVRPNFATLLQNPFLQKHADENVDMAAYVQDIFDLSEKK